MPISLYQNKWLNTLTQTSNGRKYLAGSYITTNIELNDYMFADDISLIINWKINREIKKKTRYRQLNT